MNLPGNNSITLCGKALCEILERNMAEGNYSKEPHIRVISVEFDRERHTATFALTTDKEPSQS